MCKGIINCLIILSSPHDFRKSMIKLYSDKTALYGFINYRSSLNCFILLESKYFQPHYLKSPLAFKKENSVFPNYYNCAEVKVEIQTKQRDIHTHLMALSKNVFHQRRMIARLFGCQTFCQARVHCPTIVSVVML